MNQGQSQSALSPYRALDLTDEKGLLCGKILADLGADVIKIEKPAGDPAHNIGPFYKDTPNSEKSLYWLAYNANKRGITLDIETITGQEIFKKLVGTADFVIESFPPGNMESLSLGYSALSNIKPGIIMTSITHFGQSGPYANYKGCDIVDMAMSGYMFICGDPDRPPVRISFPQAYLHAGLEAAVGTMIAFHHRQLTGEGQWVDVAIRDSIIRASYNARPFWDLNRQIIRRQGCMRAGISAFAIQRQTWPCKEGAVTFELLGGIGGAKMNKALTQWMDEEGMADDFIRSIDWDNFDMALTTQELLDKINQRFGKLFMKHTSTEIYEEAKKRRIMLYPVATCKDIVENQQLVSRDFWQEVEHPELNTSITYPGAFVKASRTPCSTRRRPPLIGEYNAEVYQELGFSESEMQVLKQANVI